MPSIERRLTITTVKGQPLELLDNFIRISISSSLKSFIEEVRNKLCSVVDGKLCIPNIKTECPYRLGQSRTAWIPTEHT